MYAAIFTANLKYGLIDTVPAFILAIIITASAMAYAVILDEIDDSTPIFSTTGKPSREIYKLRDRDNNFYVVGSMGCTAAIAFGYYQKTGKKTVVFDGDGAVLMHMGTLATIGYSQPE